MPLASGFPEVTSLTAPPCTSAHGLEEARATLGIEQERAAKSRKAGSFFMTGLWFRYPPLATPEAAMPIIFP
jgi:hypothetical protein